MVVGHGNSRAEYTCIRMACKSANSLFLSRRWCILWSCAFRRNLDRFEADNRARIFVCIHKFHLDIQLHLCLGSNARMLWSENWKIFSKIHPNSPHKMCSWASPKKTKIIINALKPTTKIDWAGQISKLPLPLLSKWNSYLNFWCSKFLFQVHLAIFYSS